MKIDEIINTFSYSKSEQGTFPYLKEYMDSVQERLPSILEVEKCRNGFMFAGLFFTYRACNHMGISLSTENLMNDKDSEHYHRLKAIRENGIIIHSTYEYLTLINFSLMKMLFFSKSKLLFNLVKNGVSIDNVPIKH